MSSCCGGEKHPKPKSDPCTEPKSSSTCSKESSCGTDSGTENIKESVEQNNYASVVAGASCCAPKVAEHSHASGCCDTDDKNSVDWIMWGSIAFVAVMLLAKVFELFGGALLVPIAVMTSTTIEMIGAMWWGVVLGIVLVGWLNRIPRELVIKTLGPGHTKRGIFRATLAGVMLDLCNHGILMVAMKLYERGASLGQVMAFLIASPWNSFTLTLILFGLVGWQLTLLFIVLSMVIAWVSGFVFDHFEKTGRVPKNPNMQDLPKDFSAKSELKRLASNADLSLAATVDMVKDGVSGAQTVIRWVLFGIVLVALIRAFVPMDIFNTWFGPTTAGLLLTLLAATIIEVCSEGSTPIAADLVNRAGAPGNAFTFLMAGASTDYTEIMAIKDTMKSWKIALLLPLVTVPQILVLGYFLNL